MRVQDDEELAAEEGRQVRDVVARAESDAKAACLGPRLGVCLAAGTHVLDGLEVGVSEDGVIEDAKFKTFGCGSAIASSSLVTTMVKGKRVEEAETLRNVDIAAELELPPQKIHCSVLAEDAIKEAIRNYQEKKASENQ